MHDTLPYIAPVQMPSAWTRAEVFYPERDGKPMGETDFHITVLLYLRQALRFLFRQNEHVYVAADMLFYYEEGNPTEVKVPDVFVVKGISKHDRRIYKLWEEGVTPCTIFEITSRSTRLEDLGTKRALYEMLGVHEYFLFDPLAEYLRPQLQGFRLVQGSYQPMGLSADGTLTSEELGVILQPAGALLRLVNSATGDPIPTMDEAAMMADEALERANTLTLLVEVEAQRAHTEAQRAEVEAQRAHTEAQRAEAAEARVAELLAEIERLRQIAANH